MQEAVAAADLRTLRMHVDPHFLLNTLNSAAALIEAGRADESATLLTRLGQIFQARLGVDDRPTVPLARELELVRAYLDIQRFRFGDRLIGEYARSDARHRASLDELRVRIALAYGSCGRLEADASVLGGTRLTLVVPRPGAPNARLPECDRHAIF